jgi:ribonucleoside-diphosphate reductase alpha chain
MKSATSPRSVRPSATRHAKETVETKKTGIFDGQHFARPDMHPFDEITWEQRTTEITDDKGKVIFKQEDVEMPATWSPLATKIAVSKYFYGDIAKGTDPKTGGRESSVKQLMHRVARTITDCGLRDGYFESPEEAEIFYRELLWLCVNQYGAFNSPVWFNVGLHHAYGVGTNSGQGNFFYNRATKKAERASTQYEYPQGSACFIQSVDDNMESIMELARAEAMLFKFGSGTGSDLSTLRSTREKMSGGGRPSGPMSFLRVYDQIAGTVKSGGKTRRAAKMNTLKTDHPDIEEFIVAKSNEERKAWALIGAGYDGSFNGDAYGSVMYQNENLSVRASDAFMKAAIAGDNYMTREVMTGLPCEQKNAREMLRKIAEGTHLCGDPGMQFDDIINGWHTCSGTDRQHSTNPCSEYLFLNNTACNLASLNLMKFKNADGSFNVENYRAAARIFIIAQEIIVDNASYPTEAIAVNSHIFRTLGLGYANLGALLMSYGYGYDSDEGRGMAAALTAIMTGTAYDTSALIAARMGAFDGYHDARCFGVDKPAHKDNVASMRKVIERHLDATRHIPSYVDEGLRKAAIKCWEDALHHGNKHGYRNAQVTVLAPTGTISFLMDCDTTGIEPDVALVKYKLLAGGGTLKIVNQTVPAALKNLGYNETEVAEIVAHIDKLDTIEGAPHLKDEHLPIFDCAFKAQNGTRSLSYKAHIGMMAAAQPFLSGAISKTVNLPETATVEDIENTYIDGWKLGLKAIAIYRDGSKRSAPLSTKKGGSETSAVAQAGPVRRRMQATRKALTHKFDISGHEGYITVGLFEDGTPGELFITMAKEGSTIGGLMDTIGTLVSLSLQYGVPHDAMYRKFSNTHFEPSGFTPNPEIPIAKSLTDYIFRWLAMEFESGYREKHSPVARRAAEAALATGSTSTIVDTLQAGAKPATNNGVLLAPVEVLYRDGKTCPECGSSKIKHTGTCATCLNCGASLGCS